MFRPPSVMLDLCHPITPPPMPTPRDITKIRLQAARAVTALKTAVDAFERIIIIAGEDDARETRKRPSLRARKRATTQRKTR